MEQSPFQGPERLQFEMLGYFEEFMDAEWNKYLGSRPISQPDRLLGAPGRIEYVLKEPITLQKGMKTYTLKASPRRPVRVSAMLQIICGKLIQ